MSEPANGVQWARWRDLPKVSPWPGIHLQLLSGERVMMSWVTLDAGASVPAHAHPHEQTGVVLEGSMDLTVGGETRRLVPGDAYTIPGGVEHAATPGPEGSVVLDLFSPPREDYQALLKAATADGAG